jgi:hypothetical protein
MADGRQLADFSLVDQPTIGLRLAVLDSGQSNYAASIEPFPQGALSPWGPSPDRRSDAMMQTTLHAFSWGLQRLGIVLAVTLFAALLTITIFVTVLVAIQAAAAFGQ